ncbi:MAG: Lcl C-terminal domain-containing protein [Polaromonas sp.]
MKASPGLTDFLNLSIGQATDAYLRELAQQNHHAQLRIQQMEILLHTVQAMEQNVATLTDIFARKAIEEAQANAAAAAKIVEIANGIWVENRYRVRPDHTVVDEDTGLMWMQSPLEGSFNFEQAQKVVKDLNRKGGFAGHTDWRLPSQDELESLVVVGVRPAICQKAFPDTPEVDFWTSSSPKNNRSVSEQYFVDFGLGETYGSYEGIENTKICPMAVRLVRLSRNAV